MELAKHRGLLFALAFLGYGAWRFLDGGDLVDGLFGLGIGALFLLRWGLVVSGKAAAMHAAQRQELQAALGSGLLFSSLYIQRNGLLLRWLGLRGRAGYICGLRDGLVVVPVTRTTSSLMLDQRRTFAASDVQGFELQLRGSGSSLRSLATAEVQMGAPLGLQVELVHAGGREVFYTSGVGLVRIQRWEEAREAGRLPELDAEAFEVSDEQAIEAVRALTD